MIARIANLMGAHVDVTQNGKGFLYGLAHLRKRKPFGRLAV